MIGSASTDDIRAIIRCLETADKCQITRDMKIPIDGLAVSLEDGEHLSGTTLKAGEVRRAELILPANVTLQLKCTQAFDGSLVCRIQRIIPGRESPPERESDSADTTEFDETHDGGELEETYDEQEDGGTDEDISGEDENN